MRPKMPTSASVMGHRFRVLHDEDPHAGEHDELSVDGWCLTSNQTMAVGTIESGLTIERQRDVFMHENLHAILHFAMPGHAPDHDEEIAHLLAPFLVQWMRANRHAVAYIMGRWAL